MKKLLFLPLVLIASFCFAQDANEIIGKPVKIGTLLVAQNDFPNIMNWDDAKAACAKLGKGWRLPTKSELYILYKNKESIGGFVGFSYWSSTEGNDVMAWKEEFSNGFYGGRYKSLRFSVRAVRNF
jgi:hypothetical protein